MWRDKNNRVIAENDVLAFSLIDTVEPTGLCSFQRTVKYDRYQSLGFYSLNEKRVIPFYKLYGDNPKHLKNTIHDAEIIK